MTNPAVVARSTRRSVTTDGRWRTRRAPVGVVGFVFEGRPNVFADACGVVRSGNTVVFRIGSDALGTARAIVEHALAPALDAAGLPAGTVQLIDEPARSGGHALFDDRRLALAVARGSGRSGRRAWCRGRPGRYAGEPARDRWRLDDRRRGGRVGAPCATPSSIRSTARCATRSTSAPSRRSRADDDPGVPRCAAPTWRPVSASTCGCTSLRVPNTLLPADCFERRVVVERAGGPSDEPFASTIDESATGHRVGVGAVARAHARRDAGSSPTPSRCAIATAPASSRR